MTRRRAASRQAAEAAGRKGEALAALYLRLKGYGVLASRVRTPLGEIDLILKRGGIIVFAEVKLRASVSDALQSVSPHAWSRIAAAAEYWRARRPDLAEYGWRYDLVALAPFAWPAHIADAWRPGLA
jgi:putative endonuclease